MKQFLRNQTPLILGLAGIGGFFTATYMAVKAAPTANDLLLLYSQEHETSEKSTYEQLVDKTKLLLPIYGPSLGVMLISSAFVLGGSEVSRYRLGATSSVLAVTQRRLYRWQEETLEMLGEKKYNELKSKVAAPQNPPPNTMIITGGMTLVYDDWSDRYFYIDDVETIRRKVNDLNAQLYSEDYVSLNDYYWEVGLDPIPYGDEMGWRVEDGSMEITFEAVKVKDTNNISKALVT